MLRHLSLTYRLSLFFTMVVAGVILGLSLILLAATHDHFIELDRDELQDKQRIITEILTNTDVVTAIPLRLSEVLNHHHGLFVQVTTQEGAKWFATDGFPPSEQWQQTDQARFWHALLEKKNSLRPYRIWQFSVARHDMPNAPLTIILAMDTTHHQHFMIGLLHTIALYALAAFLLSGLLSSLAVYYGLAPLRAIKDHAATVTAQQMHACIPEQAVPIEMADLTRTFNQMLIRLQEDFRRLSEFSSDLAHELRTPISNLLTQTQVTLASPRDNSTYRDILASNAEELQRLSRMVTDMLLLAKTENSLELPHQEVFMVADEAHALIEFYEVIASDKEITLTMQGNGSLTGDRLMFRRALSNLLSNALRHASANSQVRIIASNLARGIEIAVENLGQEIEPHIIPRLFDRFYRADPARIHPSSDGTGLGLAITKAIVNAHGGHASVTSLAGITRFTLWFPHKGTD